MANEDSIMRAIVVAFVQSNLDIAFKAFREDPCVSRSEAVLKAMFVFRMWHGMSERDRGLITAKLRPLSIGRWEETIASYNAVDADE
jgi:hypothetical protein